MNDRLPPGGSEDDTLDGLFRLRLRGINVRIAGERLTYQSLRGAPAPEDIEFLSAHKSHILNLLKRADPPSGVQERPTPRVHSDAVPLTFSQLHLWNVMQLESRSSVRSVAAVLHLHGPADIPRLQHCFAGLTLRHEALRTRFVMVSGVPMQVVDSTLHHPLEITDLTTIAGSTRDPAVRSQIEQIVYEEFSVLTGDLFAAKLFAVAESVHVLAVAMDHLIADDASAGILLRDLFAMYGQSVAGSPVCLPPIAVQFADYAQWQFATRHLWDKKSAAFWRARLTGAERVRVFCPARSARSKAARWASAPFEFGPALSRDLRLLSRREQNSLAMVVFAAFCAALLRWCSRASMLILFVAHGRNYPEVQSTVGFFGHPLFLRIELLPTDTCRDLLLRINAEYDLACSNDDEGRNLAQTPVPAWALNPAFSWNPREHGLQQDQSVHEAGSAGTLIIEQQSMTVPIREDFEWDAEPRLDLWDTERGIAGAIQYRSDLASLTELDRFGSWVRRFAQQFASSSASRVSAVSFERGR